LISATFSLLLLRALLLYFKLDCPSALFCCSDGNSNGTFVGLVADTEAEPEDDDDDEEEAEEEEEEEEEDDDDDGALLEALLAVVKAVAETCDGLVK
jgi:hypothetical protein